jgi:hypothetical protein
MATLKVYIYREHCQARIFCLFLAMLSEAKNKNSSAGGGTPCAFALASIQIARKGNRVLRELEAQR